MTQEALKLAIQLRDTASGYWTENEIPIIEKLIELLAQTQEPVGTVKDLFTQAAWERLDLRGSTKVYLATPPQRTWVGLTDKDRYEFAAAQYSWEELLIAAEAKLKEKNT